MKKYMVIIVLSVGLLFVQTRTANGQEFSYPSVDQLIETGRTNKAETLVEAVMLEDFPYNLKFGEAAIVHMHKKQIKVV